MRSDPGSTGKDVEVVEAIQEGCPMFMQKHEHVSSLGGNLNFFPIFSRRGGSLKERVLQIDAWLRLLLFQNLPDRPFREKDVIFLLKIGSQPTLAEPGFLANLLE
jgi:hypothetical protein